MGTATLHIDKLGGYPGLARCYQLEPPLPNGGSAFVTLWIQEEYGHQNAEVNAVEATLSGAVNGPSTRRMGGSVVLHNTPNDDNYIDGAFWLALQGLGGYTPVDNGDAYVGSYGAAAPVPSPEPPAPVAPPPEMVTESNSTEPSSTEPEPTSPTSSPDTSSS